MDIDVYDIKKMELKPRRRGNPILSIQFFDGDPIELFIPKIKYKAILTGAAGWWNKD